MSVSCCCYGLPTSKNFFVAFFAWALDAELVMTQVITMFWPKIEQAQACNIYSAEGYKRKIWLLEKKTFLRHYWFPFGVSCERSQELLTLHVHLDLPCYYIQHYKEKEIKNNKTFYRQHQKNTWNRGKPTILFSTKNSDNATFLLWFTTAKESGDLEESSITTETTTTYKSQKEVKY